MNDLREHLKTGHNQMETFEGPPIFEPPDMTFYGETRTTEQLEELHTSLHEKGEADHSH